MQLNSILIREMGPFRGEVLLDLDALGDDAKFVAISGRNGEGKTFLLETGFAGALYRRMPTQGTLIGRANARDAKVEVRVTNGRPLVLRHLLDGIGNKGEAVVLENGEPLTLSSKVSDFDAWAERYLPPPELHFASIFGAQGANSFVEAKDTERKSIVLRAKGIERYERLTKLASQRAAKAADEVARLQHQLDELQREQASEGDTIEQARALLDEARERLSCAKAELSERQSAAEQWRIRKRERDALTERLNELRASQRDAEKLLSDTDARIANNRAVLDDAERIRAADARMPLLVEELRAVEAERHDLELKVQAAQAKAARLASEAQSASDTAARAQARIQRATEQLRDERLVEDAIAQVDSLRSEHAAAHEAVTAQREALAKLTDTRIAGAEERITGLRYGLKAIAHSGAKPVNTATATLEADDVLVRAAVETPERVRVAQGAVRRLELQLLDVQKRLETAERLAARESVLRAAREDIEAAKREREEHGQSSERLLLEAEDVRKGAEAHREAVAETRDRIDALSRERDSLKPLLDRVKRLTEADARIAELRPLRVQQQLAVEDIARRIGDVQPQLAEPLPPEPNVTEAEAAVTQREKECESAAAHVVRIEAEIERQKSQQGRRESLLKERRAAEDDLADWNLLRDSLGRNGLQAAEVDAAGPELTDIVNELLHTCHGPRFTATIDTQRTSSDGKKLIESCGYTVIDTEKGTEKDARLHSKGEQALLGVAISFALCVMSCRKSGVERPTLVRDESDAPLDASNARVYVAMLRRAADMVGASRVIVVSHSPEVVAAADARIVVDGGRVEVAG